MDFPFKYNPSDCALGKAQNLFSRKIPNWLPLKIPECIPGVIGLVEK